MKLLRLMVVAFACALMFVSSAASAIAGANPDAGYRSSPTKGEAQLHNLQDRSEDVLKEQPYPGKRLQDQVGPRDLNVAQTDEDLDKMSTPENSQQAESVEEKVKNVFENLTGQDKR
ncbi:MAG: hypothetical protein VKK04_07630 [Synechococcales bacterium]|nr:hypothetical protein [Synechococcales bacterium]